MFVGKRKERQEEEEGEEPPETTVLHRINEHKNLKKM